MIKSFLSVKIFQKWRRRKHGVYFFGFTGQRKMFYCYKIARWSNLLSLFAMENTVNGTTEITVNDTTEDTICHNTENTVK